MSSSAAIGKSRRLRRIIRPDSGKTVIIPVDDLLIAGPKDGLDRPQAKLADIVAGQPDALLAFSGTFRAHADTLEAIPGILNVTASTVRGDHTRKVKVTDVTEAIALGVDAVAVHVNVTARGEGEMLQTLGFVAGECDRLGIPLMAIMYPRCEKGGADYNYDDLKDTNPSQYCKLIAHVARIAVDLGADLIKTRFTGDADSFRTVVEACAPVPIVIAGGPTMSPLAMLTVAQAAVEGGGAGVSFGRNVFGQRESRRCIEALKLVVHEALSPETAWNRASTT